MSSSSRRVAQPLLQRCDNPLGLYRFLRSKGMPPRSSLTGTDASP